VGWGGVGWDGVELSRITTICVKRYLISYVYVIYECHLDIFLS
jgi:hypothetical protein